MNVIFFRSLLMGGVFGGLFSVGCDAFDASLLRVDAGPNGGPTAGFPARPSGERGGDAILMVALRDVVLNQGGGRWRSIGLDLDGLTTVASTPNIECVPPDPMAEPQLDGEGGIDNAFGASLFPIVRLALPDFEEEAQANQAAGLAAFLVQIRGWNGTADDPRVDAVLSQASAGTSAEGENLRFEGFALMDGEAPAPPPAWDGADRWFARDDAYFGADLEQPLVRDDNAYVADRTLVMRLPDRVDILFFAGSTAGVRARLTDGVTFGRFDEAFERVERWSIAGRWSILDLLETGNNIGICVGTSERRIVESQLDAIADVRSRPGTGGEGVACDAISLGIVFQGVVGELVGLGPSLPLPNPCEASAPDAAIMDAGVDGAVMDAGADGAVMDAGADGAAVNADAGMDAGAGEVDAESESEDSGA